MKKLLFFVLPFILIFLFYFYSNIAINGRVPIRQLFNELINYEWVSFDKFYNDLKNIFNIFSSIDYANAFFPSINIEWNSITDVFKLFIAFLLNFFNMFNFIIDIIISLFNLFVSFTVFVVDLLKDVINVIGIFVRVFS